MSEGLTVPRLPELRSGEVHLWTFSAAGDPGAGADGLDPDERDRASSFRFELHRRRFLRRRQGVRRILAGYLEAAKPVRYRTGPHGKLSLVDEELRFNVSHTEDTVLLGVTRAADIGVDIETMREVPDRDELVETAFSPAERSAYRRFPPEERDLAFLRGWTRKEAFLKGRGDGLIGDLFSFDVSLDDSPRVLRVADAPDEADGWRLFAWEEPGLIAAVAVAADDARFLRLPAVR